MEYHIIPIADVARSINTTPAGLDSAIAQQRLAKSAKNQIGDAKQKAVWQMLLHQYTDVMILVLVRLQLYRG